MRVSPSRILRSQNQGNAVNNRKRSSVSSFWRKRGRNINKKLTDFLDSRSSTILSFNVGSVGKSDRRCEDITMHTIPQKRVSWHHLITILIFYRYIAQPENDSPPPSFAFISVRPGFRESRRNERKNRAKLQNIRRSLQVFFFLLFLITVGFSVDPCGDVRSPESALRFTCTDKKMSRVPTDVAVKDRAEGFRAISPTVHQASSFPREKKKKRTFF